MTSRQVAVQIRLAVEEGRYPPGSKLPTQAELAKTHKVGLGVVSTAVAVLRRDGLLRTVQKGRKQELGTWVVEEPQRLILTRAGGGSVDAHTGVSPWGEEAARQGFQGNVRVIEVVAVAASADLAWRLGVEPGVDVVRRTRLMLLDGQIAQIQDSWWLADLVRGTWHHDRDGDVYVALSRTGVVLTSAAEDVTARRATTSEAERLVLPSGYPVLEIWRTTYDQDVRPVEVSQVVADARLVTVRFDGFPVMRRARRRWRLFGSLGSNEATN